MDELTTMALLLGIAIIGAAALWSIAPKKPKRPVEKPTLDQATVIAALLFSERQIDVIQSAYLEELSPRTFALTRKLPPPQLIDFMRTLSQSPTLIFERQRQTLLAFADRRDLPWLALELMKNDATPRTVAKGFASPLTTQPRLRSYYEAADRE